MLMTPFRLVILRIYNVTFGRFACGAAFLRGCLLKRFVRSKKNSEKYTASSRFFDARELD